MRSLYAHYIFNGNFNPHYGWDMHMRFQHFITTLSRGMYLEFVRPITNLIRILTCITTLSIITVLSSVQCMQGLYTPF